MVKSGLKSMPSLLGPSIFIKLYSQNCKAFNSRCTCYFNKIKSFFLSRVGYETTKNCTLGASALGTRNERAIESGKKVADELITYINSQSCVDCHVQDQLIIFMALARGVSRIRCTLPLTMHTKTAIHIAELLTEAKFSITEEGATGIIECVGIGYENEHF